MISKDTAKQILKIYGKAWETQDSNLILTIFAKNAKYHEKVFEKPISGHEDIKKYWETKVCKEQADIKFKLLNFWIDNDTLIAEWEATFTDLVEHSRKHLIEVAIMGIENSKIKSLKEYWQSKGI